MDKRPATPEEVETELWRHGTLYNAQNPTDADERPPEYWAQKLRDAEEEGYQNEVCECGCVFLAFHHFTRCREEGCPFSDGVSLLERMKEP